MAHYRWLLAGCLFLAAGCGSGSSPADSTSASSACALVDAELIATVIGSAESEPFEAPPLSECTWNGADGQIIIRVEQVPDATLFVEHAIESTDPDRVTRLSGDLAGGVLFADEAVVVTAADAVVMVEGSVPTDQLTPIASAAKAALDE